MEAFLTLNPLRHEVQTHSRRVAEPSWIRTFCKLGLCAGASPSASGCARYRSLVSFRTNNKLSPRNFSCARIPVEFGDPGKPDSQALSDVGR